VFYNVSNPPRGLATGSWVRTLSTLTNTAAEVSYTLYNAKANVLRSYTTHYLGGYSQTDFNLDAFNGRLNYSVTRHKRVASDSELYIKETFTYTNQNRLLTHVHQIGVNGTPQLLYKNTYNELGQLQSKQVGGSDTSTFIGLQNVNYAYNIRGWLTAINDVQNLTQANAPQDLFALKIQYNSIENAQNNITPLYNGNIAEISWRTNSDNIRRRYGFIYDHLNRLKTAIYQRPNNAVPITNAYNESLTYDKVGNIMTLHRNGNFDHPTNIVQIDQLIYSYDSAKRNQLMKVVDLTNNPGGFTDSATNTADDYSYDSQGNMLTDANKGITQTVYNHLNLPTKIVFGTTGTIEYLYTAVGSKVQKKVTVGSTVTVTDYLGGFQYTKVGTGATVLDFFPHAEGYVKNTVTNGANAYNYVFHYTDHLGNIRVSYGLNENGVLTILEENNYYP
ncbi:MAG: hypothetical protein ACK447_11395, partial [Flavobacterium sp.]